VEVSIVIVNYRTGELTRRCLEGLPAACGTLVAETIVVDNASADGFAETLAAEHPEIRVVEQPENRGFAAGVNAGRVAAAAPYLVVLNPDTEPEPGSIERLVEHLRSHPRVGLAAPVLRYPDGRPQPSAYSHLPNLWTLFAEVSVPAGYLLLALPTHPYKLDGERLIEPAPAAHVTGAAFAVRTEAFDDAGPLDEGFFMYLEDTEWQARLGECGWRIDLIPDAVVAHAVHGGGAAADDWPAQMTPSLYRYFRQCGVDPRTIDLVLGTAAATSLAALLAIAAVSPRKRARAVRQARSHLEILRYIRRRPRA
jgi:GT2 family glycosyltransferase